MGIKGTLKVLVLMAGAFAYVLFNGGLV